MNFELNKTLDNPKNSLLKQAEGTKKVSVSSLDKPIAREIKIKDIPDSPEGYHRPYLREDVKKSIYENASKDKSGRYYLDPNTGLPIKGTPDIGHRSGHEFWREQIKAYKDGLTQREFNDRMNNPKFYQLEDPSNNRSHKFEKK